LNSHGVSGKFPPQAPPEGPNNRNPVFKELRSAARLFPVLR
jgi:hypothetical protein